MIKRLQAITVPVTLLILTLTCLSLLVVVGEHYEATLSNIQAKASIRVPIDYIRSEVYRLQDSIVSTIEKEGTTILVLREQESVTEKCLYNYQGCLYQLEKNSYEEFTLGEGRCLMESGDLKIEILNNKMLSLSGTIGDEITIEYVISLKENRRNL